MDGCDYLLTPTSCLNIVALYSSIVQELAQHRHLIFV